MDIRVDGGIRNAQAVIWAKLDRSYQLTKWEWKGEARLEEKGEAKPFPGKVSKWNGFTRHDFQVDGANVIVVAPAKPLPGRPWAWRGEFFGAFPTRTLNWLKAAGTLPTSAFRTSSALRRPSPDGKSSTTRWSKSTGCTPNPVSSGSAEERCTACPLGGGASRQDAGHLSRQRRL